MFPSPTDDYVRKYIPALQKNPANQVKAGSADTGCAHKQSPGRSRSGCARTHTSRSLCLTAWCPLRRRDILLGLRAAQRQPASAKQPEVTSKQSNKGSLITVVYRWHKRYLVRSRSSRVFTRNHTEPRLAGFLVWSTISLTTLYWHWNVS